MPAPIDDSNTYYKYALEAQERLKQLALAKLARETAATGLSYKAGAMGDNLKFIGGPTSADFKAGDAAYDSTQNINESMQEDAAMQLALAAQKAGLGKENPADLLLRAARYAQIQQARTQSGQK